MTTLLFGALLSSTVRANPEPTAYDARSASLGQTGASYLDRPAALAINPALLAELGKFDASVGLAALWISTKSPLQGPNSSVKDSQFAPLGALFLAGRIAPRVVFGGGFYIETVAAASYARVTFLDGEPSNAAPQDLDASLVVAEAAWGIGIRLDKAKKWNLGLALRLPFARVNLDIYHNLAPVFNPPGSDAIAYTRLDAALGGVGFPSPRIGLSYRPVKKVWLGASYRMYSKIHLTGSGNLELAGRPISPDVVAEWVVPHAIQLGLAYWPTDHLLLAFEFRAQFHGAQRHGNEELRIELDPVGTIVVPLGWRNALSGRLGVEYKLNNLIDLRSGLNMGRSATPDQWALYLAPPPGLEVRIGGGLGFHWKRVDFDIGAVFGFANRNLSGQDGQPATVPGSNPAEVVRLCSRDQIVRAGCSGDYQLLSLAGFVQVRYRK